MPAADDPRRRAREFALQMLYQWEVGGLDLPEVFELFPRVQVERLEPPLDAFAQHLVRATVARLGEIDPLLDARTDNWRLVRLAVVDRLILRMAAAEMLEWPQTPAVVVITEAIELARAYSGEAAVKFVNGVLDAVRRDVEASRA